MNVQFPITKTIIRDWDLGFHWDLVFIGNYWDFKHAVIY